MRCGRKTCVTHVSDQVTALHVLSGANTKLVHVSVTCSITEAMIKLDHFSVSTKLHFNVRYFTVSGCIDRSANRCCEVDTGMHFLYLINGMRSPAKSGSKCHQLFI